MARSRRLIARPPAANSIAIKPAGGNTTVRHPPQPATAARAAGAAGPGVARSCAAVRRRAPRYRRRAPDGIADPGRVHRPCPARVRSEGPCWNPYPGCLAGRLACSDTQRLANLISAIRCFVARPPDRQQRSICLDPRPRQHDFRSCETNWSRHRVQHRRGHGLFDAIPASGDPNFNPIRYWQHSIAVATLCERLLADVPDVDSGIAFVVGLCHDLGELLFDASFGGISARP